MSKVEEIELTFRTFPPFKVLHRIQGMCKSVLHCCEGLAWEAYLRSSTQEHSIAAAPPLKDAGPPSSSFLGKSNFFFPTGIEFVPRPMLPISLVFLAYFYNLYFRAIL